MTTLEIAALTVSSLIFLVGLVSLVLPIVPGSVIIWLGVLVHKLWLGDASVSWQLVGITGLLTLVGLLADIFLGLWGARRFGATWRGALGAFAGAFVGLFIPPPLFWLIVGPIIGAVLGELVAGRSFKDGGRAGFGTVVGGLLAFALKIGLSIAVICLFFSSYFIR
jgi:uncharacterized protein YqgC (DUF456 family)